MTKLIKKSQCIKKLQLKSLPKQQLEDQLKINKTKKILHRNNLPKQKRQENHHERKLKKYFYISKNPTQKDKKGKMESIAAEKQRRTEEKKEIGKEKRENEEDTTERRCTPRALLSVIQGFIEVQKDCVKWMGFGGILKMKMTKVPRTLSYFVLKNFDSETKKIILQRRVIDVTKESVKEILRFPLGRKQFSKLPFRSKEDKCYKEWTNQFEDKKMIRLQDIKMKIVSTNKADMNLTINFVSLLINSLIESSSSGKSKHQPIELHNTQDENKQHRLVFLSDRLFVLYLDRIKFDVVKKIKMRETFEKDEVGGFGTGDFNDEFVEEELNEKEMVMIKYMKLDMLIKDGINKFPEKVTLNHLKINSDAIFKDVNEDNQEKIGMMMFKMTIVWEKKLGLLKEERNNKEKIKIREVKILKEQVSGEEDETDNNDQGLDDMNLHDEGISFFFVCY
uniref:Uncharacterized protein n=1 Tax=Lactuca sativa TaxID=4236 RepID=A0A9R1WXU2_LACSA|nr:hypothetical protein LSAT_V11C800415390 [Lactuca sativa]